MNAKFQPHINYNLQWRYIVLKLPEFSRALGRCLFIEQIILCYQTLALSQDISMQWNSAYYMAEHLQNCYYSSSRYMCYPIFQLYKELTVHHYLFNAGSLELKL